MGVVFKEAQLNNGLTIVGEVDPAALTASCGFFVKTGARDEAGEVMGVSHFLEHMMFKGTDTRSAEDVNREMDEIGAQNNAYTSSEITCFYASTVADKLPKAVDVLADIMRPALREDDFQTERGVILEEIAMYRDNPFFTVYESAMEHFYAGHGLAHRVLGTPETIGKLRRDEMKTYFDTRYSADNTVVSLAGKVDWDATVAQIERACGKWARTGATRAKAAPRAHGGELARTSEKVNRGYVLMVAPAPAMDDDRRYAAMMLAQVLGMADNSRLHWALVEPGIAEEALAEYDPRDGCGDWIVYAVGDPERLDDIRARIEKEIAGLIGSITERDLERLRNKVATGVTLAGERPSGRMQRLGRVWSYLGRYLPLEDELARINAVTLGELRAVWEAYPFAPRLVSTLRPG
jgi:predicted Zn-dependent peptidase